MKRKDLIKLLEKNGWRYERNGGNHDVYKNGNQTEAVPRHREISEGLARRIISRNGLK